MRDRLVPREGIGDYYQCAELCGKEHAYMPIHVKVVSGQDIPRGLPAREQEDGQAADDPAKIWTLADMPAAR